MNRMDRLREYAKKLRTGPAGETPAQARERHALREEAERRLHEHDHVAMKYEVAEDPRVVEFRRRRLGNTLADAEIRAKLRKEEQVEPVEHVSPAQLALSRTDDQRTREKAWADDTPREGWIA